MGMKYLETSFNLAIETSWIVGRVRNEVKRFAVVGTTSHSRSFPRDLLSRKKTQKTPITFSL